MSAADPNNPWFGITFLKSTSQRELYIHSFVEHIELTAISVIIGVLLALGIALAVRRSAVAVKWSIGVADAVYSVPSIALFSILLPFTGLSLTGPIIGLVLYTQLILIRSMLDGFGGVPRGPVEAARGLGLSPRRIFTSVELPLALPTIMAGVRVATVSTVGIVIAGFALAHGGLGEVLTIGYSNNMYKQEVTGSVVGIVVVALAFDLIIRSLTKYLTRWSMAGRG